MQDYFESIRTGETGKKFDAFYEMLTDYNKRFNLTRITERGECDVKHFYDSLAGERWFPQGAKCAEVGSGAGFPSVPLMIVRPDLCFTLFESVGKKTDFLKAAVKELGLSAEVFTLRAEDAARHICFRAMFDVVCARAVAKLNTLCEYCLPLVKVGGRMVAYKGGDAEEEIEGARNAMQVLGGQLQSAESFSLPDGAGGRTIVVIGKVSRTPVLYPRGKGRERTRPL